MAPVHLQLSLIDSVPLNLEDSAKKQAPPDERT